MGALGAHSATPSRARGAGWARLSALAAVALITACARAGEDGARVAASASGAAKPLARGAALDSLATERAASPATSATSPAGESASTAPQEPPEELFDGRAIHFADLSLLGSDIEGLLDAMFAPSAEAAVDFEFPEGARALDGKRVEIAGYMIPLDYGEDGGVTELMLVRDLASCCFGGIPRPDEWIHVRMAPGRSAALALYQPIVARGDLTVGLERVDDGLLASAYQLRGESVRAR